MTQIVIPDLDLGGHEAGYEWEAGKAPPEDMAPGRWIARRGTDRWSVVFCSIAGCEYIIHNFPINDGGEKASKEMALVLVDIAWGKYSD